MQNSSATHNTTTATERSTTPAARAAFTTNDFSMLLVVLIWGANFSIVKASLTQIPPLAFTALRFTIAAVLLLFVLRWREGSVRFPHAHTWRLIWLGLVGNTLYQVLFITGLASTTAANTALLIATTPVLVLLLGRVLGVEPLTRNTACGIALAFLGITLVMAARGASVSQQTITGDVLALLSAVCWSVYTLGVRSIGAELSPLSVTTWTMMTGVPGLIVVGLPELSGTRWAAVDVIGWGGLAYAALLALVVAYVLWNTSVQRVGSGRTAVYACVTPLVATVVAVYLLGEQFRPLQAIGAVLIIGGVLLTRRKAKGERESARRLQEHIHASGGA